MPKGFTAHEKEIIQQRLLAQGYKQFSAYGLKKTNIDELAAAAGISKGAFYLFYPSKEVFFMAIAEQVEQDFRKEVLDAVDLPGPSPRARLYVVFKKFFTLFKTIPVLQAFTSRDFDVLARRVPVDTFEAHLAKDRIFLETLVARCRQAGIPIRVPLAQLTSLLYAQLLAYLHQDDLKVDVGNEAHDLLLELSAAYCVGEVSLQIRTQSEGEQLV